MLEPGKTNKEEKGKKKKRKKETGTQEKGKRASEGRVLEVLHLAAWNVE